MNAPHFKSILLLFTIFLIGSLDAAPTPPLLTTEAAKPVVAPGETNTFKVYLTEQDGSTSTGIIINTILPDASVDIWITPTLNPGQQLLHLIPYTHTTAVVPSIETASSSANIMSIEPSFFDVKVNNVVFEWSLTNTYIIPVNTSTTFDQPAVPSGTHVTINVANFDLRTYNDDILHRIEFYDETVPLLQEMGRIQMFKKPLANVLETPVLVPTYSITDEPILGEATFEFPAGIFGDGVSNLQLYIYDIDTGSFQGSSPLFSTWRDGVIIYGLDKDGTIIVPTTSVSTLNTLSVVDGPLGVDIYAANGREAFDSSPLGRVTYCFPETPKVRTLIIRYYNQTPEPGNPPIDPQNQHIWISKLYSLYSINRGPIAPDFSRCVATNKALTMYVFNLIQQGDGELIPPLTVTQPLHGTAVVNDNGSITYTPNNGYKGPDSFTYTVTDSNGLSATGTITLNVQPAILLIGGGRCVPTSGPCVQQAQPPVVPPVVDPD